MRYFINVHTLKIIGDNRISKFLMLAQFQKSMFIKKKMDVNAIKKCLKQYKEWFKLPQSPPTRSE